MLVRLVTRRRVHLVEVRAGATVLTATRRAGLPLGQMCSGEGVCASCRVRVVDGAENMRPMDSLERSLAARIPLGPDERYACRARIDGPVAISTTYW